MHRIIIDQDTTNAILKAAGKPYQTALAIGIAYTLALPSAPVDNPLAYFDDELALSTKEIVGIYNEVRAVPITEVVGKIKQVWNARYAVAHGGAAETISMGAGLRVNALTIFGIAYYLDSDLTDSINQYADEIQKVLAKIIANQRRCSTVKAISEHVE